MEYKKDIQIDLASDMDIEQVFQKHIIDGVSYYFGECKRDVNLEYRLRHDLSLALGVNINDVIIVGSAKLGYSVKNEKFVEFDGKFNKTGVGRDKSDIDIVVVNKKLYDQQAELIFEASGHFSKQWIEEKWAENIFYSEANCIKSGKSLFQNYTNYLARGWFRPDYTPNLYLDQVLWKSVVDSWYKLLRRRVSVALYSEWNYLKCYQVDNLMSLRIKTKSLGI